MNDSYFSFILAERLASDLDRIHTDDLIHCFDSGEIRTAAGEMDTTSGGFENGKPLR